MCPEQLSAKCLFSGMVSVFAIGNTVLALANKEVDNISEYTAVTSVYNHQIQQ